MKIIAKRVIIYVMVGLMQVGMFSSVAAAAPSSLHNSEPQQIVQLHSHDRHDNDRQREREMKRRHSERKRHEDKHDDHKVRDIAAILLGIAILSGASDN